MFIDVLQGLVRCQEAEGASGIVVVVVVMAGAV